MLKFNALVIILVLILITREAYSSTEQNTSTAEIATKSSTSVSDTITRTYGPEFAHTLTTPNPIAIFTTAPKQSATTTSTRSRTTTCIPWPDIRCSPYSFEDCLFDAKRECLRRYVMGSNNTDRPRFNRNRLAMRTRTQSLKEVLKLGDITSEHLFKYAYSR